MIARIKCWLLGHKRGKKITVELGNAIYECPRCRSRWLRKVKA